MAGTEENTVLNVTEPTALNSTIRAMARPMSPTRLTTKAFLAAAAALGL